MNPEPIQAHPDYAEGFQDAMQLTPLYDDATPEYEAGWRGYWRCRDILSELEAR